MNDDFRTATTVLRMNTPNWILIVSVIAQCQQVILDFLVSYFVLYLLMELVTQSEFPLGKLYAHFLRNLLRLKALRIFGHNGRGESFDYNCLNP